MNGPHALRLSAFAGAAGCLIALAGCTGGRSEAPTEELRLRDLAKCYGFFQGQNRGRTPADEKQFKEFIRKTAPSEKVDELFVSPRDNEAYVVRYNIKVGPPGPGGAPVVAYEKTGVGGK